jgi:SMI1/KNR4 family protein SUKH-1
VNKFKLKMEQLNGYDLLEGDPKPSAGQMIRQIERQLDTALPDDYVEFLQDYGCYAFDHHVTFTFQEKYPGGNKGVVNVFFGVDPGETYNLWSNYIDYQGRVPSNLLPIANDPGGNLICLSVTSEDKGTVYFWDHEEESSEEEELRYANVYRVADSFTSFINSLESKNL